MRITQPKENEPIRLTETKSGPHYRATLTTGVHADGRRRQTTKTFASISKARDWVSETRLSVKRGTFSARDKVTLDALIDRWLESKRDVRPVTLGGYRQALETVREHMGHREVQSLRRADVEALVGWLETEGGLLKKGLSRTSIIYTLGRLHQVLEHAVAEGIAVSNPAHGVKPPRKKHGDDHDVTIWTPEQLLTFRATADLDPLAAAWCLTLCGLRRSEVMGLRWSDLDLDKGTATIAQSRVRLDGTNTAIDAPKSKASERTVPIEQMHPGSVSLLRTLSAHQAKDRLAAGSAYEDSGYVVVDALGRPVPPENYSARFRVLCREAGVPAIRLHNVRHSVATMLVRNGVAPADSANLLGHSVAVFLSAYVTATQDGLDNAGTALAQILASAK